MKRWRDGAAWCALGGGAVWAAIRLRSAGDLVRVVDGHYCIRP